MTSRLHDTSINTAQERRRGSLDRNRSVRAALYLGLTATVVATITPYLDQATSRTLAHHIQVGYPSYARARIATAVTTYEVILTVIGVLGVASWIIVIRAVARGMRWAAPLATAVFMLGLGIALTSLLLKDTSGDTGLSALLGWIGVLPCLPGLLAVTLLWRKS
jgi:hypothetical protein